MIESKTTPRLWAHLSSDQLGSYGEILRRKNGDVGMTYSQWNGDLQKTFLINQFKDPKIPQPRFHGMSHLMWEIVFLTIVIQGYWRDDFYHKGPQLCCKWDIINQVNPTYPQF